MNKLTFLAGYIHKISEDIITGGKADGKGTEEIAAEKGEDPKDMKQQELKGTAVEMEHTNNPEIAGEVADDHLDEIPDYYDRLGDMEEEAKMEKEKDLGDPSPEDRKMILQFIMTQPDLDDETLHALYTSLGVDPHEGEEIVYSAMQSSLQGQQVTPDTPIQEKEVEMDEEEE